MKKVDQVSAITDYFRKSKKSNELEQNQNEAFDIFEESLNIQSESIQLTESNESNEVPNEELLNTIARFESMLSDERKAKEKWIEKHNTLKEKYVSNLQLLVKTQDLLLRHSMFMKSLANTDQIREKELNVPVDIEKSKNVDNTIELLLSADCQEDVACHISDANMVKLNSIKSQKSYDSTFITALLEILYDRDQLKCRTVSGRSRTEQNKQAMTPNKLNLMKQMFLKRIHSSSATAEEKIKRINDAYINRAISNAINNINKKKTNQE